MRSRTVVRVNGHLPDFGLGHQPLSAAMTHEISEQGAWQTTLFSRISSIIRPFNLALSTTTQIREQEDIVSEARLLVGTLVGDFRLRGEMGFDISPETAFSQANMSADWRINENFGARVGLKHVSGDEEVSTASAGIFRDFDGFNLGVGLEADSKGDYSVQLGLSFSFGHNPATDSIEFSSKPFAKRSAVSALVFLDRDNDGVFDPEDTAIENAGFSGSRVPQDITTSEDGTAFIVGLQPYRDVKIGLNEATLEDPFWVPSKRPKYVSMRPGTSTTILFPVIETGEVDGVVLIRKKSGMAQISTIFQTSPERSVPEKPDSEKIGSGLRILLIDDKDQIVSETTSGYDGFFFMDRIPYGRYRLQLDQTQLEEQGYAAGPPRRFSIGAEEPFAASKDLIVISD